MGKSAPLFEIIYNTLQESDNDLYVKTLCEMKDHFMPRIERTKRFEQVKQATDDYIDCYNNEYYVWNLSYLSPNEYYEFVTTGIYPLKIPNLPKPPVIEKSPEELGKPVEKAGRSAEDKSKCK